MSTDVTTAAEAVVYPDSDGKRMADNTLQWDWMVKIVGELRELFSGQEVFVAGDLLWYPVKGEPTTVTAPDALVAFGRPAGYRGSYKQWEEGGVTPQVVFEILSPSNTRDEMDAKRKWYDKYGVEEYYCIDPIVNQLHGWTRREGRLESVVPMKDFVSPRLGIRFDLNGGVKLYTPDGREFQTREQRVSEIEEELRKTALAFEDERERALTALRAAEQERERAEQERERAEQERERAEQERERAEQERLAKERFAVKLRELGVNPDDILKPTG
jgi:Uma2 family endonuclease